MSYTGVPNWCSGSWTDVTSWVYCVKFIWYQNLFNTVWEIEEDPQGSYRLLNCESYFFLELLVRLSLNIPIHVIFQYIVLLKGGHRLLTIRSKSTSLILKETWDRGSINLVEACQNVFWTLVFSDKDFSCISSKSVLNWSYHSGRYTANMLLNI